MNGGSIITQRPAPAKEGSTMDDSKNRKIRVLHSPPKERCNWNLTEADKTFLRSCNIKPE